MLYYAHMNIMMLYHHYLAVLQFHWICCRLGEYKSKKSFLPADTRKKSAGISSLHPKQFPLLGPVFGEAFAEFGKGERGRFFTVEDGFDDVRGEVDQT